MDETQRILAGRFELAGVVGRGGMGTVYRATDLVLGRTVAVKVLAAALLEDPVHVARFEREARAAASLSHPAVVAVYDTGVDDGTHFIVMELVRGQSLAEVIGARGRLDAERAVGIAARVADALSAAHAAGLVHRDVKPSNVMLTDGGGVKVLDFGIARALDGTALTQTASVLGTAAYMAPEQALGDPADARSDIYSLGCLLYALLAGRPPFAGRVPAAITHQHVHADPVPLRRADGALAPALDALVMEMLSKSPAARPQTAADVCRRLERILTEAGVAGVGVGVGVGGAAVTGAGVAGAGVAGAGAAGAGVAGADRPLDATVSHEPAAGAVARVARGPARSPGGTDPGRGPERASPGVEPGGPGGGAGGAGGSVGSVRGGDDGPDAGSGRTGGGAGGAGGSVGSVRGGGDGPDAGSGRTGGGAGGAGGSVGSVRGGGDGVRTAATARMPRAIDAGHMPVPATVGTREQRLAGGRARRRDPDQAAAPGRRRSRLLAIGAICAGLVAIVVIAIAAGRNPGPRGASTSADSSARSSGSSAAAATSPAIAPSATSSTPAGATGSSTSSGGATPATGATAPSTPAAAPTDSSAIAGAAAAVTTLVTQGARVGLISSAAATQLSSGVAAILSSLDAGMSGDAAQKLTALTRQVGMLEALGQINPAAAVALNAAIGAVTAAASAAAATASQGGSSGEGGAGQDAPGAPGSAGGPPGKVFNGGPKVPHGRGPFGRANSFPG